MIAQTTSYHRLIFDLEMPGWACCALGAVVLLLLSALWLVARQRRQRNRNG